MIVERDDGGGIGGIIGGLGDVVNGVSGAISYWSDPWTNTFKAMQGAAAGLSRDLLPALTDATLPDLSADWFIRAYQVSFATAIFVAVALLIPQVLRTARGQQAGRDLIESAGIYFGLFLGGAIFGPALGIILVNFFHSLSDVFVSWGVEGSIDGIIQQFLSMIEDADPVGMSGGVPLAVLLMFLMLVGLTLVLLMLLVQLVTLYFTGVLIPLGLVWMIDPGKRSFALKLVGLWVGILAAHPLLFFLLGFAFTMMAGTVSTFGNNLGLQTLVTLAVAVIALFVAALSPMMLLKFAPVIPGAFGGTNGPAVSRGTIGPQSMSDAVNKFGTKSSPSQRALPTTSRDIDDGHGGTSGVFDSKPSTGGLSAMAEARAKTSATVEPAMATAKVAPAASGAASASAGAAGLAEGAAAAGAAESATGVGAAIGVPTLIVAAGITAASKGIELTQRAGEQATAAMDDRP